MTFDTYPLNCTTIEESFQYVFYKYPSRNQASCHRLYFQVEFFKPIKKYYRILVDNKYKILYNK